MNARNFWLYIITKVSEGLTAQKDALQAIQAAVTVIAILVGGWWTWTTFLQHRHDVPWARVENLVVYRDVTSDHKWIRVEATVSNQGRVALKLAKAFVRLSLIKPVPETIGEKLYKGESAIDEKWGIVKWDVLDEREILEDIMIEPSEQHTYRFDFFVPCFVETVYVYSFFPNDEKSEKVGYEFGWSAGTVIDVKTST